jgi:hypothetical protein
MKRLSQSIARAFCYLESSDDRLRPIRVHVAMPPMATMPTAILATMTASIHVAIHVAIPASIIVLANSHGFGRWHRPSFQRQSCKAGGRYQSQGKR